MTSHRSKLRCKKFGCDTELDPIGNVSYGPSRFADGFMKWGLVGLGVFMLVHFIGGLIIGIFGLDFAHYWFPPTHITFILGVFLIYGIGYLIPKTTKITCHQCGHVTESIGLRPFYTSVPNFSQAPPSEININEAQDFSVIDLEEVKQYHIDKKKFSQQVKQRRGRRYSFRSSKVTVPGQKSIC